MSVEPRTPAARLRVFCLEDNPLIAFHLEQMIEDLGHVFAGSLDSFVDLQSESPVDDMDCALVDIDLADGPSGPSAVEWLTAKGVPCAFVTGQEAMAARFADSAVAVVAKPITEAALAAALSLLAAAKRPPTA
jgi:CheY-like chemotaxis protein